jgi:cytochrome c biogenesis protein CcdA/thioredoxin-related protein
MLRKYSLLLIGLFISLFYFGQIEDPSEKVKWSFSYEQVNCEVTLIATINMNEHWHISAANLPLDCFSIPTSINIDKSPNYLVDDSLIEPQPLHIYDSIIDEHLYWHSGTIEIKRKITINSKDDITIKGYYSFQTCDDTHCLPPYDEDFEIKVRGCSSNEQVVISNKKSSDKSLLLIFLLSFISGFAALLTPCVFPMIPMTVSFFTKQSKNKSTGIRNAIFYGISIILIYVILGTLVTAIFGSDALNALSTNVWFNILFFVLLVVFAISFMGAFEITLPNSWINKADSASDKGGLIGIFFMAFTLALVSFSCTGPIVGTLLVEAATIGGIGPFVGMFGFSLALALPFGLFAAFPGWLNSLPKSGGWLNTVKVFLGFLELALAFKFLSNADLVVQGHYLERELFLAIWIGVFSVLALYLLGFISLPHDSPIERLSVGRTILGISTIIFVIYLIPGLWGAPLKLISGFPPPMAYSESPFGVGSSKSGSFVQSSKNHESDTHIGPQGLPVFHDLDKGLEYAKKVNKPAFLDFTGHACVNCRKMEENVWGEPGVIEMLTNNFVIISLYVDDKRDLPINEQKEVEIYEGKMKKLKTIGNKWSHYQATKYKVNTQPYYRILSPNGEDLDIGSADYEHHGNADDFSAWLSEGLELFKN